MTDERHAEDIVQDALPLYGPYSREQTIRAAYMISETFRYLNYATQEPQTSLPQPNAPYDLLGGLHEGLQKMPQLLQQIQQRLRQFAADPDVVDHRHPNWYDDTAGAHESAAARLADANAFLDTVAAQVRALDQLVMKAQSKISSIGVNDASEEP